MSARPEILTLGHSTHPIERFLELLRSADVAAIADVRRYPASRRNPQFDAAALAASLEQVGVDHEWFGEELGGRRTLGRADRPSAWQNRAFRAYADHMAEPPFAEGLGRLERLAAERLTAVVCAEADWRRCHRRLIADALVARGWRVLHLLADGRSEAHRMSPHALVDGATVTYPAQPALDV